MPAHRVILCAASEWWRTVLSSSPRHPEEDAALRPHAVRSVVAAAAGSVTRVELDACFGYNTLLQCLVITVAIEPNASARAIATATTLMSHVKAVATVK